MFVIEIKQEGRELPMYFRLASKWHGVWHIKLTHSQIDAKQYKYHKWAEKTVKKITRVRSYKAINIVPLKDQP